VSVKLLELFYKKDQGRGIEFGAKLVGAEAFSPPLEEGLK
jgi:hypothetical protein